MLNRADRERIAVKVVAELFTPDPESPFDVMLEHAARSAAVHGIFDAITGAGCEFDADEPGNQLYERAYLAGYAHGLAVGI